MYTYFIKECGPGWALKAVAWAGTGRNY